MSGTLFIVATPIGNLDDLTPRARQTLASVDLIAAEDTRHTGRLLSHIGAKTPLLALHDHNEDTAVRRVIEALKDGKDVALVSDAGTPLVSDPGYRLLRAAHAGELTVVPVPGASAATAALSVAGLPTDRFCFEGFAPPKRGARRAWLKRLANEERTLVIFESVHRIDDCIEDMAEVFGIDRQAFIGRELSKMHEQCVQAGLGELRERIGEGDIPKKGEFVVVVEGSRAERGPVTETDRLLLELDRYLSAKDVVRVAVAVTGGSRNAMYERLQYLKSRKNTATDPDDAG